MGNLKTLEKLRWWRHAELKLTRLCLHLQGINAPLPWPIRREAQRLEGDDFNITLAVIYVYIIGIK